MTPLQEKLDTLVRDVTCRTKPLSKSEARTRIQEYADDYLRENNSINKRNNQKI